MSRDLEKVARALGRTPRAAYSVPHVYPSAAPAFVEKPMAPREHPASPVLRLYVHIPFCNYACTFCCYAKKVGSKRDEMERYVRALRRELEWVEPGTPVSQFFMGGGTPTALPPDLLDEVLGMIAERMPPHGTPVHTVETSPESATDEHLAVLKARGVGRISMGIQSLANDVLDAVYRGHDPDQARRSAERVVAAGFILNIDLMYGLPGQTFESLVKDFEIAAATGVHAVTAYSLRLNEYTPLARVIETDDQLTLSRLMEWRTLLQDTAARMGFTQTRWHTFKRMDSIAAKHDRLPHFDDSGDGFQLGIGQSARSQLGHTVFRNHRLLKTYLERVEAGLSPVQDVIELDVDDRKTQFVARSMGDGKPLSLARYREAFGTGFVEDHAGAVERLTGGGLIACDGDHYFLTDTGKLVYDLVTLCFYPAKAQAWLRDKLNDYQLADVPGISADVTEVTPAST